MTNACFLASVWAKILEVSVDYAVVLCTPYSVQKGIVREILHDITSVTEGKIVLRELVVLTIQDIEIMYPRLIEHEIFLRIVECLTSGVIECLLLIGDGIHERINNIKGKFRYSEGKASATGLRAKFQKDGESFEFIFHSTDSNRESDEIGVRIFGEEFLNKINLNQEG